MVLIFTDSTHWAQTIEATSWGQQADQEYSCCWTNHLSEDPKWWPFQPSGMIKFELSREKRDISLVLFMFLQTRVHSYPVGSDLRFFVWISFVVWVNIEGSRETAQMRRLAWTFAVPLCGQWATKVLLRLCGCVGWSAPLLFAYIWQKQFFSQRGLYVTCSLLMDHTVLCHLLVIG